jgi:hypothetical protein
LEGYNYACIIRVNVKAKFNLEQATKDKRGVEV